MGLFAQVDLVNEQAFVTSEAFRSAAAIERGYAERLQELGLHTCMDNAGTVSLSCGMKAFSFNDEGEPVPISMIGMITFRLASRVRTRDTDCGYAFDVTERRLSFRVVFLPERGLAFENDDARPMTEAQADAFGRWIANTLSSPNELMEPDEPAP